MKPKSDLGEKLRAVRVSQTRTLEGIAGATKIRHMRLKGIEAGTVDPLASELQKLSTIYGVWIAIGPSDKALFSSGPFVKKL